MKTECTECGKHHNPAPGKVRWVEREADGETWNVLQQLIMCPYCQLGEWHDVPTEKEG